MFDVREKEPGKVGVKWGDIVIFVTIVIATAVNFTDFGFSFQGINRITALSVLLYIVTTMTYNHCYNKGKMDGKQDEEYLATAKEYHAERDSLLHGNLIGKLPDFLEDYIKSELVEYRKGILLPYDLNYEEYAAKYLPMPLHAILRQKMRFRVKLAIIKCNRAKPVAIKKSDLISCDENSVRRSRPMGMSGHKLEKVNKLSGMLWRALMTIFSGTVCIDLVFNFSWTALIQWGIRMLPILFALIFGRSNGFLNITEVEAGFKKNQIYMIRLCKEWCAKESPEETVQQQNTTTQ